MKKFLTGLCLAAAAAMALATPAQALCVSERDIVSTTPSNDGKLLTLKMRDGRVLVNHLQGICSDLRFNGFVWVLRGTNDICENQQTIGCCSRARPACLAVSNRARRRPRLLRPRRLLPDLRAPIWSAPGSRRQRGPHPPWLVKAAIAR